MTLDKLYSRCMVIRVKTREATAIDLMDMGLHQILELVMAEERLMYYESTVHAHAG